MKFVIPGTTKEGNTSGGEVFPGRAHITVVLKGNCHLPFCFLGYFFSIYLTEPSLSCSMRTL